MSADFHDPLQEPREVTSTDRSSLADLKSPLFRLFLVIVIFVGFAITVYALQRRGFDSPMIYDARAWIENKAHIFGQHDLSEVIGIVPARPLFMLTLYVNYLLSGMEPAAFRLTNALIVAATGMVLVLLSMVVFRAIDRSSDRDSLALYGVSLFLGLVFVVHPLQSLTVLYIWQREAILACFFYYSALAVYIASRSGQLESGPSAYILTGILFLAGLLSKENVATLPVVLILVELILFHQDRTQFLKYAAKIVAFAVPVFAAYVWITHSAQSAESVHTTSIGTRLAEYYEDAGIRPLQVALTESRIIFSYLSLILVPSWAGVPLLRAEIISTSVWDPWVTFPAVVGLVGLVALSVVLVRKRPLISFGILFFLVSSAPEAILLPQYLFCGYRAILPMAGVLIALGDIVMLALSRLQPRVPSRALASAVVVVAAVPLFYLSVVTISQARRWNPFLFWNDAYTSLPRFSDNVAYRPYSDILSNYGLELVAIGKYGEAVKVLKQSVAIELSAKPSSGAESDSPRTVDGSQGKEDDARANLRIRGTRGTKVAALINLGQAWEQSGNMSEAMKCFQQAVDIWPRSAIAHNALAGGLRETGQLAEAILHFRKATELDPAFALAYNGLGLAVEESGDVPGAINLYQEALKHAPGLAEAHNNLGTALEKTGDVVSALDQYRQAIACNPRLAQAHNNLGNLLRRFGKIQESIAHQREAIRLDPSSAIAYSNLGAALEASGNMAAALASFRKAVELRPDLPDANYALASALLKAGKSTEAVKYLRKTISLNPHFMEAHANLGMALLSMGKLSQAIESLQKAVAINNNVAALHNALGVALAQSGRRSEAAEHFQKALHIDPNDVRARQNLQKILKENAPGSPDSR